MTGRSRARAGGSVVYALRMATGLPVLADIEAPLEQEMGLLVIINEARDSVVVTAGEHAGGSIFLLDYTGHRVRIKSQSSVLHMYDFEKRCSNLNSHRLV